VHATLDAQDPAHSEQSAREALDLESTDTRSGRRGHAWLWLAALIAIVGLSLADSLMATIVPYERDTAVFYYPLMSWVGQQLRQGVFPLWTPQFFGGYPIFADGEIGLAYPPALLALLTLPADRALIGLRVLHLTIAAVGTFVLARTWRLPYPSAVLAGVVVALGNFFQAQIHHENIVRTASWMPLILAFVELALRARTWREQVRWMALAAVGLGLAGLALHSQMLAIDLILLAAYGAFRWAVGPLRSDGRGARWLRRLLSVARVCVPVVVAGIGIAAVQLIPLVELASFSARGSGIPYSESAAYSLTVPGLAQLVFPYVFRNQGNLQWGLWTHWESYLYIGLAPLVLAVVALVCVRRREVAGWACIGLLGLVLSLGQYSPINLHYMLWLLPGMSGLRAPGRFTFIVVLAGGMLAAYGLAWLMSEARFARGRVRGTLIGLSVAAVVGAIGVVTLHQLVLGWPSISRDMIQSTYLALPRDTYQLTADNVLSGLLWSTDLHNPRVAGALLGLAAILAILWVWQFSRWGAWRIWPAVLIGIAAVDLLLFDWAIHPREPLSTISAEPASVQAIEQYPSPDAAPNRVLASPAINEVSPDRLAPFGSAQEANGYSSLEFVWHRDYLDRVLYADDSLLDLWGVRYILDPAHYGTLSNYAGVDFLPQQALLHAPADSALSEQAFALASASPITELRFVSALEGGVSVPQGAPVAEVELRDAAGQVVGTAELQAGRDSMDWAAAVPSVTPAVQHQQVQVAAQTTENGGPEPHSRNLSFADMSFSSPVSATTLVVRATPPVGEFVLFGGAAIGADGSVNQLFGKTDTKYRLVYADNQIRVLEDTSAFSRAFIVPEAQVAPSLGTALNQMIHQPFQPTQEVILADDATTQSSAPQTERGGHGSATVTAYGANSLRVHTSTDADAWLVISDTYYPGWAATIDGQAAPVLRGDVLFRVVPVPAGDHEVELDFQPASIRIGLLISLGCVALVLAALALTCLAGRQRSPGRTT
jgi:hypothetical protein